MALTQVERKRLIGLLGMLGSEHAGERDTAARMVEKFRVDHGIKWEDLLPVANARSARDVTIDDAIAAAYAGAANITRYREHAIANFLLTVVACGIIVILAGFVSLAVNFLLSIMVPNM